MMNEENSSHCAGVNPDVSKVSLISFEKSFLSLLETGNCMTFDIMIPLTTKLTGGNGAQRNCRPVQRLVMHPEFIY